jgi:glycosyltransferase involved in cell wall biosynthesis
MGGLEVAARTFWNARSRRELSRLIDAERPDLMHCTNTFPLISPSAYSAAHRAGVPVVQSLRNYRQLCPNALLLREGRVCEDCLGKRIAWPGVQHGCYRGSRLATAVVAGMTAAHRLLGTWRHSVDQYFTLTEFARAKFIAAGWPADKIAVKPNFVDPDPGAARGDGGYAIFVGRLSEEKGIACLLDAWRRLEQPIPLKIVGRGPLEGAIREAASSQPHIELIGHRPIAEVLDLLGAARLLVMPSIWYETFGRTIIEAYAKGTPVVASRLGAMAELVAEPHSGLLFEPRDPRDLALKVSSLWNDAPTLARMRLAARQQFENHYTADTNYRQLLSIYGEARASFLRSGRRLSPSNLLPETIP